MYLQILKMMIPALKENKKYTSLVVVGVLSMIVLSVGLNRWRQAFYNDIQAYHSHEIYIGLIYFTVLALSFVFVYGVTSFYTRYLEFGIRQYLFNKFIPHSKNVHQSGLTVVEQRIQDDSIRWARSSVALMKALLDAGVRLPVFLFILASIAKWWMLLIVLLYAIGGTIFSRVVAKKLIKVEYMQETYEAELRRDIIEYNNSKKFELPSLRQIIGNWQELALRQKHLSWYTNFFGQISYIFPYCMLVPMFLSKAILLGTLQASVAAIEQVLGSLSVLVDNRELVVDIQMTNSRIKEMEDKIKQGDINE
jgi:vitamin B12/bleomycin/antimicrobial peptide transport system ATP-binding/permease protein